MIARCRLGQLNRHVSDVADIGENPDLGLPCLALDDRLELTVHGELHVAQVVGKRRIGRQVFSCAASGCRESLQIARNELKASTLIVDRQWA